MDITTFLIGFGAGAVSTIIFVVVVAIKYGHKVGR